MNAAEYASHRKTSFEIVPFGVAVVNGFVYSQTVSPSGVTSKKRPWTPSQISVWPFASRCAPGDVVGEQDIARGVLFGGVLPDDPCFREFPGG